MALIPGVCFLHLVTFLTQRLKIIPKGQGKKKKKDKATIFSYGQMFPVTPNIYNAQLEKPYYKTLERTETYVQILTKVNSSQKFYNFCVISQLLLCGSGYYIIGILLLILDYQKHFTTVVCLGYTSTYVNLTCAVLKSNLH